MNNNEVTRLPFPGSGSQPVFDENRESGENHVLDLPWRKYILLYCRYCVGFCI